MGLTDMLWGKATGQPVPSNIQKEKMYTLTNQGRQQVESMAGDEGVEFDVLSAMTTKRAWSLKDLGAAVKLGPSQCWYEVRVLMKQGFVKPIGANGE
jgi:hypothetical protein